MRHATDWAMSRSRLNLNLELLGHSYVSKYLVYGFMFLLQFRVWVTVFSARVSKLSNYCNVTFLLVNAHAFLTNKDTIALLQSRFKPDHRSSFDLEDQYQGIVVRF